LCVRERNKENTYVFERYRYRGIKERERVCVCGVCVETESEVSESVCHRERNKECVFEREQI